MGIVVCLLSIATLGWPTHEDPSFCYAESTDAIHWTKPNLGLFTYQGSTNNNILFRMIGPPTAHSRVHGTSVFLSSRWARPAPSNPVRPTWVKV